MIAKIEDKNRRTEQVDNERSPFDLLMSEFVLYVKRTTLASQKGNFRIVEIFLKMCVAYFLFYCFENLLSNAFHSLYRRVSALLVNVLEFYYGHVVVVAYFIY